MTRPALPANNSPASGRFQRNTREPREGGNLSRAGNPGVSALGVRSQIYRSVYLPTTTPTIRASVGRLMNLSGQF
jgi:hypothetical protein